jgi:hypothetical protein
MTWKLYALMSGGGAVAAYALSLTSPFASPVRETPQPVAVAPPSASVDMQALADGLSERVEAAGQYRPPSRDAFSFARDAAAPGAVVLPPAVVPEPLPLGPPAPPFGLFGVMGEAGARTVMLSSLGGVTFAGEGDTVGGAWRVLEIGQAFVTLESLAGGERTTLRLFGAGSP